METETVSYGLILGTVLALLIVLGNVIIPNNGSDSAPLMLITAAVIGLYIIWASYRSARRDKDGVRAIKVGAVTSLIGFSMAMLTFVIIDNVFLSTVSKQADKIWGYQHSSFGSMQAYINAGLVRGVLVGLPASIVFGIVCGAVAGRAMKSLKT